MSAQQVTSPCVRGRGTFDSTNIDQLKVHDIVVVNGLARPRCTRTLTPLFSSGNGGDVTCRRCQQFVLADAIAR